MAKIYITPAGLTAAKNAKRYFNQALGKLGPFEGMILLTSKDVTPQLHEGITDADYPFSVEILEVENPYSGVDGYYDTLADIIEALMRISLTITTDKTKLSDIECVINSSGGTTKFSMWMHDLSHILSIMLPNRVRVFFATFNPEQAKVRFTEKPMLSDETIKQMLHLEAKPPDKK